MNLLWLLKQLHARLEKLDKDIVLVKGARAKSEMICAMLKKDISAAGSDNAIQIELYKKWNLQESMQVLSKKFQ